MRLRLPEERPAAPPEGYKLANAVLSHDGGRAGFAGVSLGGALPYGFFDEARCVYGRRHRCPALRCDCGFYCLHTFDQALALACASQYRKAVLLEVTVLGAYIRFERGMRYERQRVRVARVGACACGGVPCAFADAGWGRTGWRVLTAVCAGCAARRGRTAFASWTAVSFAEFVRLGGGPLRIVAGGDPEAGKEPRGERPAAEARTVPELAAEASLMQARLDRLQRQLARFTGKDGAGRAS